MNHRLVLVLVLAATPVTATAQRPALDSMLDPGTARAVAQLIDSAQRIGLPTSGMLATAQEGARLHAAAPRIVAAVHSYLGGLITARGALGTASSPAELAAGVGAILSGVSPQHMRALRDAQPHRSLVIPLVVVSDLTARGVPVDTATRAVYVTLAHGADDADLSAMRRSIEADIQAGAAPGTAAVNRLNGMPGITPDMIRRDWPMRSPSGPIPR